MAKAVDHVCAILYDKILTGGFEPGQQLREEELTEITGVSRTPVREGLRRLVQEGFVEIRANRGAFIPVYTKKDLDEIFGMRTLLESHAARRAAARITPEQIARLQEINDEFRAIMQEDDSDRSDRYLELTRLNGEFHEIILDAADNRQMARIVQQLARLALSARTFARLGPSGQNQSAEAHDEIVQALKAGQPDWAEAAMRSHIHRARLSMSDSLEEA